MHIDQQSILDVLEKARDNDSFSYQELGLAIRIPERQRVWYHVSQLQRKNLLRIDPSTRLISKKREQESPVVAVPLYGAANCGDATAFADNYVTGYLRISKKLLEKSILDLEKQLVAVQAIGDSMNKAEIGSKKLPIKEDDYVLIDIKDKDLTEKPKYVASIINGMANIKKAYRREGRIELVSESSSNHPPIFVHKNDNYLIAGRVVQVIPKELS